MIACGHCGRDGCRLCHLYRTDPVYRWHWDGQVGPRPDRGPTKRREIAPKSITRHKLTAEEVWPCTHRGAITRGIVGDVCPERGVLIPVHACAVHRECMVRRSCRGRDGLGLAACSDCPDRRDA